MSNESPFLEAAIRTATPLLIASVGELVSERAGVINSGLDADFDPDAFEHYAYFNQDDSRIEMHLRPRSPQVAHLRKLDLTIEISPEETIWTESSYKFTRESVAVMLSEAPGHAALKASGLPAAIRYNTA